MPKINQEEYEVLKELDDKWEWIARDKDKTLVMGAGKNERYLDGWFPPENVGDSLVVDEINAVKVISEWGNLFQFIQWEDESPYNIQELIEEYLYDSQPKLFIDGQEQSFEFIEESEETEVKDLEWVKAKLKKDHKDGEVAKSQIKDGEKIDGIDLNSYWRGRQTANYIARCYLEDLDEPETLSEDWIQEHSYSVHLLGTPDVTTVAVPREDLQNLLVPKQELPVIPKFVAKWISEHHERFDLYPALKRLENNAWNWEDVYEWYRKNTRKFANAYLTGKYEVEEEQKYYVLDSEEIPLLERVNNQTCKTTTGLSIYEDGRDNSRFELTEQEIKDYDERFWPFAVKSRGVGRRNMTYYILAASDKLYLSEYIPGDHQLTFTTARSKALRFSPEEKSHMEELMYLYDLHELRFRDPIVNASAP